MRRRISEFEIRARLSIEVKCVNEVELKSFALNVYDFSVVDKSCKHAVGYPTTCPKRR